MADVCMYVCMDGWLMDRDGRWLMDGWLMDGWLMYVCTYDDSWMAMVDGCTMDESWVMAN